MRMLKYHPRLDASLGGLNLSSKYAIHLESKWGNYIKFEVELQYYESYFCSSRYLLFNYQASNTKFQTKV